MIIEVKLGRLIEVITEVGRIEFVMWMTCIFLGHSLIDVVSELGAKLRVRDEVATPSTPPAASTLETKK